MPQVSKQKSPASESADSAFAAEWALLAECGVPSSDSGRLTKFLEQPLKWPRLIVLAEDHGMLPLLSAALANIEGLNVPAEIQRQLHERSRARAIFTLNMTAELFRLLELLQSKGIETLVTKGPALAQRCYGNPAMRQYDDLDLIIRQKDMQRASELIIAELAYEPRISAKAIDANKIPGEYIFRVPQSRLLMEFHTEKTLRYHPRRLQLEKLFQRHVLIEFDGRQVPSLSAEDELTLICIHGAKHFWERLMWVADVAALVSRASPLDPQAALASACEVGAQRMLRLGLGLASALFGVRLQAKFEADLHSDPGGLRLVAEIAHRMAWRDAGERSVLERATFRVRMREDFFRGAAYLVRLALSPTEEDWRTGGDEKGSGLLDAVSRPFRLARKYSRAAKN